MPQISLTLRNTNSLSEILHGLNPIIDFLEKIFYGSHNEVLVC